MGDCGSKTAGGPGLPKAPKAPEPKLVARACGVDPYYVVKIQDYLELEKWYKEEREKAMAKGKTDDEAHAEAMKDRYVSQKIESLSNALDKEFGLDKKALEAQDEMLKESGDPEADMEGIQRSAFREAKKESRAAAIEKLCTSVVEEVVRKRVKGEMGDAPEEAAA